MNGMRRSRTRRTREQKQTRILLVALALVIFAGMFLQVAMLSRISGQQKASRQLDQEIRELSASAENLNLSLNQLSKLERVDARARELGMDTPTQSQIRVVNLPGVIENTSTQSAEAFGAEEIQ